MDKQIIIQKVQEFYKMNSSELNIKSRKTEFVKTRQITMFFLREMTHMSFADIGKTYHKDHATAMHAYRHVNDLYETDKEYRSEIHQLRRLLLNFEDHIIGISLEYNLMKIYGRKIAAQDFQL